MRMLTVVPPNTTERVHVRPMARAVGVGGEDVVERVRRPYTVCVVDSWQGWSDRPSECVRYVDDCQSVSDWQIRKMAVDIRDSECGPI